MKKHPILIGLALLVAVGLIFLTFLYGMSIVKGKGSAFTLDEKIAIVEIDGLIKASKEINEKLKEYEADEKVAAIVLRINSPGGGVVPSQEIYDKVREIAKTKRVVASMGSLAASGGYYIACASERIIANPGTITGSIGVIIQFSHVKELLDKIGLRSTVVKGGAYKDIGSPVRDMTSDEKKLLQAMVDDIHEQFIEAVATSRNISKERMKSLADGRIFTGRQALKAGLVDELGNLDRAVGIAAKLAGIEGKPHVIYPEKKKKGLLRYIIQEMRLAVSDEISEVPLGIYYLVK